MLDQAREYGFANCIALCDGVVNEVTSFDRVYTSSWTTRKHDYGIVSLVMCDLNDRILWYSTGNCGSRNDSGLWKDDVLPIISELTSSNSDLCRQRVFYFSRFRFSAAGLLYCTFPKSNKSRKSR